MQNNRKTATRPQQITLSEINRRARINPLQFTRDCERSYAKQLRGIAQRFAGDNGRHVLMLAGPSSAGKTTTSIKLARSVRLLGKNCSILHLDDFYKNRKDIPKDENGRQNFEGIDALELDLLQETLRALLKDGRTSLPQYDFTTGRRRDYVRPIHLHRGDAVIIEGLHALNPQIFDSIQSGSLYKAYVNIGSSILDKDENVWFGPRDIRLLRRIIRDYNYRNSSVINTLTMWPDVVRGEEKNLFPYQDEADFQIDSFHPYEICIYKKTAETLLDRVSQSGPFYMQAERLMDLLQPVEPLSTVIVPRSSLLQEFIK